MADWRDLALEHLPQLKNVVQDASSHIDLWQQLKELLSEAGVDEARAGDVQAVYDYAWWCHAESGDPDLPTEVATFFYEDLPVYSDFWEQLPASSHPISSRRWRGVFAIDLLTKSMTGSVRITGTCGRKTSDRKLCTGMPCNEWGQAVVTR
jgi:hypothetical protein